MGLILSIVISTMVISQEDTVTAAVTIGITTICIRGTRKERQNMRRGTKKKAPPSEIPR
jgi:hypothetical protein